MTPELKKELIVGILSALFTALFTGVPAAALFWWTWQRDQERLIVQKLLNRWPNATGGEVLEKDEFGPTFGILIRNRSLFQVHVSEVGFSIDGTVIRLEHPVLPSKMKRNPDRNLYLPFVLDEDFDPWEIPSQSSLQVNVAPSDRARIGVELTKVAAKYRISVETLVGGTKLIALVASETGKQFSSMSFSMRIKSVVGKVLLPPE